MNKKDFQLFIQPHILKLEPYKGVEPPEILAQKAGITPENILKLDANENPYGPSPKVIDRIMKINLIAEVDSLLEWDFKVLQETINVKIGENKTISYKGKNLSGRTITSTANFVVSPESIDPYLVKTECFCFTEQTLKPEESKIFTMVFYLDPSLDSDSNFDKLKELVFTYEFSEYKS